MQWGLIGTGGHAAQRLVPAMAQTRSERLHGVVGSSPEKAADFASRVGAGRAYPSLDAMLADSAIEAVLIATPNDLHYAQTIAAASAGKHVLLEKPMALNAADCRAMIAACMSRGSGSASVSSCATIRCIGSCGV